MFSVINQKIFLFFFYIKIIYSKSGNEWKKYGKFVVIKPKTENFVKILKKKKL